jgi:hypothetical protein
VEYFPQTQRAGIAASHEKRARKCDVRAALRCAPFTFRDDAIIAWGVRTFTTSRPCTESLRLGGGVGSGKTATGTGSLISWSCCICLHRASGHRTDTSLIVGWGSPDAEQQGAVLFLEGRCLS